MGYFRTPRNIFLSSLYYLETQVNADWNNISVIKSFRNAYNISLPVICLELITTTFGRKEIGNTTLLNDYGLTIDIFATSDGQRLDLADYVEDKIKGSWTFYTHSQSGGVLTRTDTGTKVILKTITENHKVEIFDNPERQDRFRHLINFLVRKF